MSVDSTTRKSTQVMTIDIVEYDFTFRALTSAPSDIKCIRTNTADKTDEDMTYVTELPSPTSATDVLDFIVTINEGGDSGTVKVAYPSTSSTITIYRETTDTQESAYEDFNQFPAKTVENDFDKRTMISQEKTEDGSRALTIPITSTASTIVPVPVGGTYLGWDDDGSAIENKTLSDLSAVAKATEAQAVAKTNNDAYMTPLRVAQAIRTLSTITLTGGQIKFPGTAVPSADANTLDDYEEEEWTPSIGGNATYTIQRGKYTKIGNVVFIVCNLKINSIGSGSTSLITGLPFQVSTAPGDYSLAVSYTADLLLNVMYICARAEDNTSQISFSTLIATGDTITLTTAVFKNSTEVRFSGFYIMQ